MFPLLSDGEKPPILGLWESDVLEGARYLGFDLMKPYEELMRDQGFKEIKCVVKEYPIWHKTDPWLLSLVYDHIKRYSIIHLLEGPEADLWEMTGIHAYVGKVKQDVADHKGLLSLQMYVVLNPHYVDAQLLTF